MQNHPGTFRAFFATLAAAAFLALTLSSCAVTVALPGGGSTTTTPIVQPPNTGTGTVTGAGGSSTGSSSSTGENQGSGGPDDGGDSGSNSGTIGGDGSDQGTTTPGDTDPDTGTDGGTTDSPAEEPKLGEHMLVPEGYTVDWSSEGNTLVLTSYTNSAPLSRDLELPTGGRYKIGDNLFENGGNGISINGIIIPDDVIAIGKSAFQHATIFNLDAKMYELTIPQSVAVIGEYAFAQTSITKLTLKGNYSAGEIGKYAFASCSMLENVIFEGTIAELPEEIFNGANIKNITLPTGVKTIGSNAFANSALETIYIPATVKSIDPSAFDGCYDLKTILFGGTAFQWADCSKGLLLSEDVTFKPEQSEPAINTSAVEFLEKLFSIFL